MGSQVKLYRNSNQIIQPNTWTVVTYETAIRNDRNMAKDLSLIVPCSDGDFIWARNLRWASIALPYGDTRQRQFMSRFIRDPYGIRDDTGAADKVDSPGKDWETTVWLFRGEAGEPVAVEVWHDHSEPVALEHAQFSGTTWDY